MTSATVAACKKPPPPPEALDAGPPDHLAPDEVVVGTEKAFGLALPKYAVVYGRFPDSVLVRSQLSPEQMSNFVRSRVKDGKYTPGMTISVFEDVVATADPTRHLTIEIRRGTTFGGPRSEMSVRDVTIRMDPKMDEAEGWKRAGMSPDGKRMLDPKNTQ